MGQTGVDSRRDGQSEAKPGGLVTGAWLKDVGQRKKTKETNPVNQVEPSLGEWEGVTGLEGLASLSLLI